MTRQQRGARPPIVVTPELLWEARCLRYPPEWREIVIGALRPISFRYWYEEQYRDMAQPVGEKIFLKFLDAPNCGELCEVLLQCALQALTSPYPVASFLDCMKNAALESCRNLLAQKVQELIYTLPQYRQVSNLSASALQLSVDGGNSWETIFQVPVIRSAQAVTGDTAAAEIEEGVLKLTLPRGAQGPQGPAGPAGPAGPPGLTPVLRAQDCSLQASYDGSSWVTLLPAASLRECANTQPPASVNTQGKACAGARGLVDWVDNVLDANLSGIDAGASATELAASIAAMTVVGEVIVDNLLAAFASLTSLGTNVIRAAKTPAARDEIVCKLFCQARDGSLALQELQQVIDEVSTSNNPYHKAWAATARAVSPRELLARFSLNATNEDNTCAALCECEPARTCVVWLNGNGLGAWVTPTVWPGQPTNNPVGAYDASNDQLVATTTSWGNTTFKWGAARLTLTQATQVTEVTVTVEVNPAGGSNAAGQAIYLDGQSVASIMVTQPGTYQLQFVGARTATEVALSFSAYANGYARVKQIRVEASALSASLGGNPCA